MKLIFKCEGGTSPGLTIVGERADLLALADQLKAGATEKEEGVVPISDAIVAGYGVEWLEFQVVKNLEPLVAKQKKKERKSVLAATALFIFMISIGYLVYRGIKSF